MNMGGCKCDGFSRTLKGLQNRKTGEIPNENGIT
jgi:hypothetical protein